MQYTHLLARRKVGLWTGAHDRRFSNRFFQLLFLSELPVDREERRPVQPS